MAPDEILERVCANIGKHGWHVQSVILGPGTYSMSYTVGLTAKGLPELLMVGFDPSTPG